MGTDDERQDGWPDDGFLDRLREIAEEIERNKPKQAWIQRYLAARETSKTSSSIAKIKGLPLMNTQWLQLLLVAGVAVGLSGCPSTAKHSESPKADAHDHDHDHAHSGTHKGHLMEIGEEEFHAEWTHDESGKVTFYILDADATKEVPIAADAIAIDVKIGENAPKTYELAAVAPANGKSAAFEITDKQFEALFDQLKSPGLVLMLHVNINGKQFDQQIKEHEHAH